MSYDIDYIDPATMEQYALDEPLQEGGTRKLGGNTTTWLNVTYNYSWYYHKYLDEEKGIRWLYGRTGRECIGRLEVAISEFADHRPYTRDYWAPTPGNCIQPLKIFLEWCWKWPGGIFEGD